MNKVLLYVFLGSGIGGVLRYIINYWISTLPQFVFPLGTFIVNVIASFLVGAIVGLLAQRNSNNMELESLLIFGFCGGFSTFSAFSYELLTLIRSGNVLTASIYAIMIVFFSLLATFAGMVIFSK